MDAKGSDTRRKEGRKEGWIYEEKDTLRSEKAGRQKGPCKKPAGYNGGRRDLSNPKPGRSVGTGPGKNLPE